MSKKNLDKLFQEKFKDFGEVPDEKVWDAIEASLNKKKRKRVIPIWWKLGGVAAVLALALIVWNPFSNDVDSTPKITNTDNGATEKSDIKKDNQEDVLQLPKTTNEGVVEKSEGESPLDVKNNTEVSNDAVTDSSIDDPAIDTRQNKKISNEKSPIVNNDTDGQPTNQKPDVAPISKDLNSKSTQLTASDTNKTGSNSETYKNRSLKKEAINISGDKKNEAIVQSPNAQIEEDIVIDSATAVVKNATSIAEAKNDVDNTNRNADKKESTKFTTGEKVAQNDKNSTDANTETDPKKKSIFEAIDEQNEEEVLAEASNGRWSAGPSIAPVYFNGIGEGSPVHSIFTQNAKSGNTNLSYGLSVAYEISSKLRVRSGIHKVDFGYDTDNVEFSSSLQASVSERIENINYSATAKNLVVKSEASSSLNSEASTNDFAELNSANSSERNGTMAQQFGYLEVPLELDYALIDRKFGVNLVGGISSLFLLDNSVLLSSGDLTTEIGEANNVNNVNFSTNIGFGVNYKFSPKIQLNIEPVFKYQLNTFSEVSGDFRPFSVGVYSGLNFKF